MTQAQVALQFLDNSLKLLGDGSEWLETETLNYYHDQNQCQTLAVLGGMVLIMYDTHADEFWIFHTSDAEGNCGLHSMVNDSNDITFCLWDSTQGKVLYRIAKHGQRTGESYKGAVIRVKSGNQIKSFTVTDVSGNCVTATCGSMNKDFQFPHDLKRLNILDITLPNDGQLMHLESCICVGSAATLSFKAGTLTRLKLTTAGPTVIHRMSRTNERDFNVGDSNISGSDFFAKLSRCSPLTNQNGSIFESDNRKSRKGPQCVPVYHDSGMYYSMFMAGQNKQALKGWQHEHLNSAGIVAEVCHSQSSRTWSLPTLIADPLFDGCIEYAVRVNVTRDLFGFEGSAYNRCFDKVVRNHTGGADGNTYAASSCSSGRHQAVAVRDCDARDASTASLCRSAAAKLDAMLAANTITHGSRILSVHGGPSHKLYSKSPELEKFTFWQSFNKVDSTVAHKIWQLLKKRCPQDGNSFYFTAALHTTMRTIIS